MPRCAVPAPAGPGHHRGPANEPLRLRREPRQLQHPSCHIRPPGALRRLQAQSRCPCPEQRWRRHRQCRAPRRRRIGNHLRVRQRDPQRPRQRLRLAGKQAIQLLRQRDREIVHHRVPHRQHSAAQPGGQLSRQAPCRPQCADLPGLKFAIRLLRRRQLQQPPLLRQCQRCGPARRQRHQLHPLPGQIHQIRQLRRSDQVRRAILAVPGLAHPARRARPCGSHPSPRPPPAHPATAARVTPYCKTRTSTARPRPPISANSRTSACRSRRKFSGLPSVGTLNNPSTRSRSPTGATAGAGPSARAASPASPPRPQVGALPYSPAPGQVHKLRRRRRARRHHHPHRCRAGRSHCNRNRPQHLLADPSTHRGDDLRLMGDPPAGDTRQRRYSANPVKASNCQHSVSSRTSWSARNMPSGPVSTHRHRPGPAKSRASSRSSSNPAHSQPLRARFRRPEATAGPATVTPTRNRTGLRLRAGPAAHPRGPGPAAAQQHLGTAIYSWGSHGNQLHELGPRQVNLGNANYRWESQPKWRRCQIGVKSYQKAPFKMRTYSGRVKPVTGDSPPFDVGSP